MDDSPEQENPRCTICSNPKNRHAGMKHPFSDPKNPISPSQVFGKTRGDKSGGSGHGPAMRQPQINSGSPDIQVMPFPFDPVLRQALIAKGVITVEDLKAAEEHIKNVTTMGIVWQQTAEEVRHASFKTNGG